MDNKSRKHVLWYGELVFTDGYCMYTGGYKSKFKAMKEACILTLWEIEHNHLVQNIRLLTNWWENEV